MCFRSCVGDKDRKNSPTAKMYSSGPNHLNLSFVSECVHLEYVLRFPNQNEVTRREAITGNQVPSRVHIVH